ncbi:MAG: WXG100 family type VII secretion target [Candidatus Dormibacteraeota bacterium]|nr:WXG100 family type VII secretion target [Candidatus Dormibacteraeota bacterium]
MGQQWDLNPVNDLGNVGSDVLSFLSGPPGDPSRVRQVASQIQTMGHHYQGHVTAINEAVDELSRVWTGDAATSFLTAWHSPATTAPQTAMQGAADALANFARQLNDYADRLEHAQHEHWLQLGIMGALLVVDVAQLGLDPLTDAAAVGIGAATAVGVPFIVAEVGTFALEGALVNFASDVVSQLGADAWDHLDGEFDHSGDHAVPFFDGQEAETSALQGAVSFGLARSGGELLETYGGRALLNPWARTATVGALSATTDAAGQLITTGNVNWGQSAVSGSIGGLAGGHLWRAEDVGRVEALGRFYDPETADMAYHASLTPDNARGGGVKPGMGGGGDEATSVIRLQHAGLIDGPVQRSPVSQADFVDGHGQMWDVKSPQDTHARGGYELGTTLGSVDRELRRQENVVVNIEHLSRANARELITAVRSRPEFAGRVLFSTSKSW